MRHQFLQVARTWHTRGPAATCRTAVAEQRAPWLHQVRLQHANAQQPSSLRNSLEQGFPSHNLHSTAPRSSQLGPNLSASITDKATMSHPPGQADENSPGPMTDFDRNFLIICLVVVLATTQHRVSAVEEKLEEITRRLSDQETIAVATAAAAAAALPFPPAPEPPRQRRRRSGRGSRLARQMVFEQIDHGATEDISW